MRRKRAVLLVLSIAAAPTLLFACGSRTGLLAPDPPAAVADAGRDARRDTRPPDVADDVVEEPLPPIDAAPLPDANRSQCADAGDTLIYVVSDKRTLLSFDPTTALFHSIGTLGCQDTVNPFSMAVDRKGIAYVLYANGQGDVGRLYRVSTANASCATTTYSPGQRGFDSFGMGFSADNDGPGETLFIASDTASSGRLGAIDIPSLTVRDIGVFTPTVLSGELTGTGDGRLFAFYSKASHATGLGSFIGQIEKTTGNVLAETPLPTVDQGSAWAFAFWGGDFYLFTSPLDPNSTTSSVRRFRPSDGTITYMATFDGGRITGAGVSTCAPSQ